MEKWRKRWRYEVAAKASSPGVWRLKDGGYLIACRVTDPKTGRRTFAIRVLRNATHLEARRARDDLQQDKRDLVRGRTKRVMTWSAYATSLFERKVVAGDIKSAKTSERWETTLRMHLLPAFGQTLCHELRYADIEDWKVQVAKGFGKPRRLPDPDPKRKGKTIRNPEHAHPRTANGWLSILRVICKRMAAELELERDPALAVRDFDTSEHPTYTDENPNAITAEWAAKFLAAMRELYPQHYAMTLLGFVTGLRPSSMRPLRRRGAEPDVLWDEGVILVRRSNSMAQEVMDTTKTKRRIRLHLPEDVMTALKAHVAAFEDGPQTESDLLFPARHGGLRSRSVLDKPFAHVARVVDLPYRLTPKGMRRTNKDLMRAADVPSVVSKAISGHTTEQMHEHYSTAAAEEVRAGIGKVSALLGRKEATVH